MKRGGPPERRKRLGSNAETQREWERRTRRAQLDRQRNRGERSGGRRARDLPTPEPVKRNPAKLRRPGRADPPELTAAKREVRARSGGLCEANWPGVCPPGPHRGEHVHHVILRSQGGPDAVWNLLHVCRVVHVHAHDVDRAGAEARGIIRRWRAV